MYSLLVFRRCSKDLRPLFAGLIGRKTVNHPVMRIAVGPCLEQVHAFESKEKQAPVWVVGVVQLANGNKPVEFPEDLSNLFDPSRKVAPTFFIENVLDEDNDHLPGQV